MVTAHLHHKSAWLEKKTIAARKVRFAVVLKFRSVRPVRLEICQLSSMNVDPFFNCLESALIVRLDSLKNTILLRPYIQT